MKCFYNHILSSSNQLLFNSKIIVMSAVLEFEINGNRKKYQYKYINQEKIKKKHQKKLDRSFKQEFGQQSMLFHCNQSLHKQRYKPNNHSLSQFGHQFANDNSKQNCMLRDQIKIQNDNQRLTIPKNYSHSIQSNQKIFHSKSNYQNFRLKNQQLLVDNQKLFKKITYLQKQFSILVNEKQQLQKIFIQEVQNLQSKVSEIKLQSDKTIQQLQSKILSLQTAQTNNCQCSKIIESCMQLLENCDQKQPGKISNKFNHILVKKLSLLVKTNKKLCSFSQCICDMIQKVEGKKPLDLKQCWRWIKNMATGYNQNKNIF